MEIMTPFDELALPHHLMEDGSVTQPQHDQQEEAYLKERGNRLKMQVSDLQAFKWKCQMMGVGKFPASFKLIKVTAPNPHITLKDLNHRNFSVLAYPVQSLVLYAQQILKAHPQRQALGQAFDLGHFIQCLAEKYQLNAYHNFTHAFSVQLMLFQLYNRSGKLRQCMNETQWFYTFIAALAHDLSHPGTNNSLEVRMKTPLAMEAGNSAVLEKFHLGELWRVAGQSTKTDLFAGLGPAQAMQCKKLITRLIMATDVSRHNEGLSTLRGINQQGGKLEGQRAMLVMEQVFHASDIGNPCLDFDNYMNWGALVSYEFDLIGNKEKQLGFEVSPGMQHSTVQQFYAQQKGFCDYLVLPLWKELTVTFEEVGEFSGNVERNVERMGLGGEGRQP